jgi:hypothetical protein
LQTQAPFVVEPADAEELSGHISQELAPANEYVFAAQVVQDDAPATDE